MASQIKYHCPACGGVLTGDETTLGQTVDCLQCGHSFVVSSVKFAVHENSPPKRDDNEVQSANEPLGSQTTGTNALYQPSDPATIGALGRFKLLEILGQGSFGRVYKAFDPQLDRFLALKIPTFTSREKRRKQRFLVEAKAAAQLRHPNIVPTYESGQIGGRYYIAAEFISGQTLSARVTAKQVDFRQAAQWMLSLAEALSYAHGEGIVHRDIKPDNIVLDVHDAPQIMDFGLAKRDSEQSNMTTDGTILGTPAYMAPEQARGDIRQIGPASDQYSLGVVLYELLTGQRPFKGAPHKVISDVIHAEPAPPTLRNPQVPRDLEAICRKAMSKDIVHRYESMDAMADDLRSWLAGQPTIARAPSLPERAFRWCQRSPVMATAVSAAVVAVLLVLGLSSAFAIAQSRGRAQLGKRQGQLRAEKRIAENARARARHQMQVAEEEKERAEQSARKISHNIARARQKKQEAEGATKRANETTAKAKADAEIARSARVKLEAEIDAREQAEKEIQEIDLSTREKRQEIDDVLRRDQVGFYADRLERTMKAIEENELDTALTLLNQCPNAMRHWEWEYLVRKAKGLDCVRLECDLEEAPEGTYNSSRDFLPIALAFTRDQNRLVARSASRSFQLVDISSGRFLRPNRDLESGFGSSLCVSQDGQQILTWGKVNRFGSFTRFQLWRIDQNSISPARSVRRMGGSFQDACFNHEGKPVALGATAGETIGPGSGRRRELGSGIFDIEGGQRIWALPTMPAGSALLHQGNSVLLPDGRLIAIVDGAVTTPVFRGDSQEEEPPSNARSGGYRTYQVNHHENGYSILANRLIHVGVDQPPDQVTISVLSEIPGSFHPAIHPNGKRIVCGDGNHAIFIDVESGREVLRLRWAPSPELDGKDVARSRPSERTGDFPLTFSADGRVLAGMGNGVLRVLALPADD